MEEEKLTEGKKETGGRLSFWGWCRRYISLMLIFIVGSIVYILFFNEYSVARSFELSRTIDSLEAQKKLYTDTFTLYRSLNGQLKTSPEKIEEILRTQHGMSRLNEDVYIMN